MQRETYAHMPAVPSSRVVSQRVGANPRAAHTPAGRPCTQKSWKSEEKKEA